MNKKLNTVIFLIVATLLNIIIMLAVLVLLLAGLGMIISSVPESLRLILYSLVFFGALIGSYFIYHKLLKFIMDRYGLEQYLSPFFKTGRKH